ncbi:hypothetical protein [Larkinella terrae]|uniref:ZU5 domain-containing protein n=1 Tax=Larkinella terrae TaxID=2025311 RepID=A0A7K0EEH7_9BACT|nr:hypothetical protein [Larkinella terrae]MRS60239.1 hypothetical protein [Larkinella terrae]
MKFISYAITFLVAGLLACQKPTDVVSPVDGTNPSDTTKTRPTAHSGVIYAHGTPVGQLTQKSIGPEGGTLASADGTLTMIVPAGAVAQATTFSVQPVTPTLPGLLGGQSFRLLPEGQTFAQPIKLQYKYQTDSLDGTSAQALFLAYQGNDGYWKALLNTELDETAQTLTVRTRHFSDWGAFAEYTLEATPDVLFAGQTAELTLSGYYLGEVSPLTPDEITVELAQRKTLSDPANIRNWRVIGKGHVDPGASRTTATYTAPANLPQGRELVSVEVYNILPASVPPRKGDTGKVVLLKAIYIEGTYFRLTINGQPYDCTGYLGIRDVMGISFMANLDSGNLLNFSIHSSSLKTGTFPYSKGKPQLGTLDGKADVYLTDGGIPFESFYDTCESSGLIASAGSVTIGSVEVVNGVSYARGSMTCKAYFITGNCPGRDVRTRTISAEFRVLVSDI